MSKVIIYEPAITGHHVEYLTHIINFLIKYNNLSYDYYFLINKDFVKLFNNKFSSNIKFIYLSNYEIKVINKLQFIILRDIANYYLLRKYTRLYNPNQVIILDINTCRLSLFFYRNFLANISGILFHPYTSEPINRLRKIKEKFFTILMLSNPRVKRIFVLDDDGAKKELNMIFNSYNRFEVLPDPINATRSKHNFNPYFDLDIKNRKVFLHFGALSKRKGTLEIIKSINYLPERILQEVKIVIIGKAVPKFDKQIKLQLNKIKSKHKNCIIYINRYLPAEEIESYITSSSCLLIPYKNYGSSSGIIGLAAKYGKPVIGPDLGYLGKTIKKYSLGYGVKCLPKDIALAISNCYDNGDDNLGNNLRRIDYIKEKTPDKFVKTLMKSINL